jgi:hypothetical protein
MASVPGFVKKRKILFGKKTPKEELVRVGNEFAGSELYDDAIEFFSRADAKEEVAKIAEKAYEMGDTSLYMRAKRVMGEEIGAEEWEHLAELGAEQGRYSMAFMAYSQAGEQEKADQMRQRMVSAQTAGPGEGGEGEEQQAEKGKGGGAGSE